MIQIEKEHYDSVHDAQIAAFVKPDPRFIDNADNIDEAVDKAKAFIEATGYKGNIEILDYTPYTLCSPAKRQYFKMVRKDNNGINISTHPDAH